MIDTLFIDLDCTLLDSSGAVKLLFNNFSEKFFGNSNLGEEIKNSFKKYCNDANQTLPHTDYLKNIGCGWDNMFYTDFSGSDSRLTDLKNVSANYKHFVIKSLLEEFSIYENAIIKLMEAFLYEKWVIYYKCYSDTFSFLEECEHYKKYILTNGFTDIQMKKIHHFNLHDKVDIIFIAGEYGIGKPFSDFFNIVLDITGANIKSTAMIGNSLSSDIAGANNMGIKTIWKKELITSDYERNIVPTAMIENLSEIPALLLSM